MAAAAESFAASHVCGTSRPATLRNHRPTFSGKYYNRPNSLGRKAEGQAAVVKVAPVSCAPLHTTLTSQRRARHTLWMAPAWHTVANSSRLFMAGRSQALPHPSRHKEGSVLPAPERPWENRLCLRIPATQRGCEQESHRAAAWQPPPVGSAAAVTQGAKRIRLPGGLGRSSGAKTPWGHDTFDKPRQAGMKAGS